MSVTDRRPLLKRNKPEYERINFLIRRDGEASARQWVERTLAIYRAAIESPASHASKNEYRLLFKQSIYEFEEWLGECGGRRAR